jgi:hypothetical protein
MNVQNVLDRIAGENSKRFADTTSFTASRVAGRVVERVANEGELIGRLLTYDLKQDDFQDAHAEGGDDALAWYSPFHFFGDEWGIFFDVEKMVQFVSTNSFGDDPALIMKVLYHEQFHFIVEALCADLQQTLAARPYDHWERDGVNLVYKRFSEQRLPGSNLFLIDEAMANAFAVTGDFVGTSRVSGLGPTVIRDALCAICDKAPAGYRDYMRVCRPGLGELYRSSRVSKRKVCKDSFRNSLGLYRLALIESANVDFSYFDQPILGEAIVPWALSRQKSILGRVPMYLVFPAATNDLRSVELPDTTAVKINHYLTVSDIRGRVGVEISEGFKKSLDKLAKKNVWIRTAWEQAVKKLEDGTMNAAHVQKWPKGGKDVFSVRVNNIRSPAYRAHLKAQAGGRSWLALDIGDHKSMGHG